MTVSIYSLVPSAQDVLELQPEELAGVLMTHLNSLPPSEQRELNRHNFGLHTGQEYPQDQREELSQALMEAWAWLECEGLLVPKVGAQGEWVVISRRGQKLRTRDQVRFYRRANWLPRQLLHPKIAQIKVWASFLRGDYDTAVFQAFREVEVEVRKAAKCGDADIGVDLMWKAFREGGPLADATAHKAEQQALAHIFAGAIGSYKNPHSHRSVTIESTEAAEMLVLASHLLGIVDKRSSNDSAHPPPSPS